jgi:hypothetical protein
MLISLHRNENTQASENNMTYTDAVINNKKSKNRAISITKKEALRLQIKSVTGWYPPKNLSMKEMKRAIA